MNGPQIKEILQQDIQEEQFDGQYSDSGSSTYEVENGEEELESTKDEIKKNKLVLGKKKTSKKAGKKPKTKQKIVFNVADCKYKVIYFVGKKLLKWRLQYEQDKTDWDITWTDNAVQPEQLGKMGHHQKINHFPGMYVLSRKNNLGRLLMKMKKQFPDHYKFFPQTWILPADFSDFKNQFDKKVKGKAKTYIVKPSAGCQGRGIYLTRNLEEVENEPCVIQRYMHKPYLIDGLKFDLRIYVLVAGCDPLRIFVFEEGLTRFSTQPYMAPTRDNLDDLCMHLTNYAINKDNPNFEFNTDDQKMDVGHKRSLASTYAYLEKQGHDIEKLKREINDIIIKTLCCGQPVLAHEYKACQPDNYLNNMCFELLGLDVFLDDKLKPYVLEVNHTPSFSTDTPLDSLIKKNAIRDALKIMNISLKNRNEIVQQRKEIMQKRVLTGKKVKLTLEEKQELIRKGQIQRNEYEDKNCGGYTRIYPVIPKFVKPVKKGEEQQKQQEKQQEDEQNQQNEDDQKEEQEEDIYQQFIDFAKQIYGQSTGADIKRNIKKVDAQKIEEQKEKKVMNRTKDIEKIYNQKNNKSNIPRSGTSNSNMPPSQSEKQVQQLEAMNRLYKGGSSQKVQFERRSIQQNREYQNLGDIPPYQEGNEENDEQYINNLTHSQNQFRIKGSKNNSYSNFTRKQYEFEINQGDYNNQQYTQQYQQNQQQQEYYLQQQQQQQQHIPMQQIVNKNVTSPQEQDLINKYQQLQLKQQQQFGTLAVDNRKGLQNVNGKGNFINQNKTNGLPPYMNDLNNQRSKYQQEKGKQVLQGYNYNSQLGQDYSYNQRQEMGGGGGLFVTPKLFDLNMLQKQYGGNQPQIGMVQGTSIIKKNSQQAQQAFQQPGGGLTIGLDQGQYKNGSLQQPQQQKKMNLNLNQAQNKNNNSNNNVNNLTILKKQQQQQQIYKQQQNDLYNFNSFLDTQLNKHRF